MRAARVQVVPSGLQHTRRWVKSVEMQLSPGTSRATPRRRWPYGHAPLLLVGAEVLRGQGTEVATPQRGRLFDVGASVSRRSGRTRSRRRRRYEGVSEPWRGPPHAVIFSMTSLSRWFWTSSMTMRSPSRARRRRRRRGRAGRGPWAAGAGWRRALAVDRLERSGCGLVQTQDQLAHQEVVAHEAGGFFGSMPRSRRTVGLVQVGQPALQGSSARRR